MAASCVMPVTILVDSTHDNVTVHDDTTIEVVSEANRATDAVPKVEFVVPEIDPTTVILDIDEEDRNDAQAVTAYVNENYNLCKEREVMYSVTHDYMCHQPHINEKMRYILIDWLMEVHLKFKLLPETMGLTVNLVDRFLSKNVIIRDNLQLVGIACMFTAAKYEEIYPPECNDFVHISASTYSRETIIAMEAAVLNSVGFNITVPTSMHFLRRLSKAAFNTYPTHNFCKYLLELAMVDMRMNKYYPSMVAAAAVYIAREMDGASPIWTPTLEHYSGYTEIEVFPAALELLQVAKQALKSAHQAVTRKYTTKKFGEVAKRALPEGLKRPDNL